MGNPDLEKQQKILKYGFNVLKKHNKKHIIHVLR